MPERDAVENKTEEDTAIPKAFAIIAEREILIFYVVLCFRFRPQITRVHACVTRGKMNIVEKSPP